MFRRTLTPFCPSAALAEIGAYVARDAALTPVVAIRGADGIARAFRNACRHRGVQLVDGAGCRTALTCRYHGWTYGLDGRLRGIPDDYGFPGLDKSTHGLVPLTCIERDGLVFVSQDAPPATSDAGDMPTLFGDDWKLYATTTQEVEANWTLVWENNRECLHCVPCHPQYVKSNFDVVDEQTASPALQQKILAAMRLDKKVSGGEIKFVLARRIGAVEFGHQVPADHFGRPLDDGEPLVFAVGNRVEKTLANLLPVMFGDPARLHYADL